MENRVKRILGCDPGDTTGFALVEVDHKDMLIHTIKTAAVPMDAAPALVRQIDPDFLIIEQFPERGKRYLHELSMRIVSEMRDQEMVKKFLPGRWKPPMHEFMSRRKCWTQHEDDAAGILVYWATFHSFYKLSDDIYYTRIR